MNLLLGSLLALAAAQLQVPGPGTQARVPSQASQRSTEFGLQIVAVSGQPAALVAGPAWAWRPGLRDRLVLTGGLGASQHQLAFRGEAVWQFRLEPAAEHGVGVYLGGGLAAQAAESTHGFLIATVGLETSPGGSSGWLVELGVGGGVRLALGYRWR